MPEASAERGASSIWGQLPCCKEITAISIASFRCCAGIRFADIRLAGTVSLLSKTSLRLSRILRIRKFKIGLVITTLNTRQPLLRASTSTSNPASNRSTTYELHSRCRKYSIDPSVHNSRNCELCPPSSWPTSGRSGPAMAESRRHQKQRLIVHATARSRPPA